MYLCYVDESGTADIPGNTSHFVLAGLAIPIWHWKALDRIISEIKRRYQLQDSEIHTAWMMRKYHEQEEIRGFVQMTYGQRRRAVEELRVGKLLSLQRHANRKRYNQTKKNFAKTEPYVHLTHGERVHLLTEIARTIAGGGSATYEAHETFSSERHTLDHY
jgi:hypothetical protein